MCVCIKMTSISRYNEATCLKPSNLDVNHLFILFAPPDILRPLQFNFFDPKTDFVICSALNIEGASSLDSRKFEDTIPLHRQINLSAHHPTSSSLSTAMGVHGHRGFKCCRFGYQQQFKMSPSTMLILILLALHGLPLDARPTFTE